MQDTISRRIEVKMPQLAESVVSATISKWLKQPGDKIEAYEAICEIITDKVNAEVPCTVSGILAEIVVEEGATVDVDAVICVIEAKEVNSGQETGEEVMKTQQPLNSSVMQNNQSDAAHKRGHANRSAAVAAQAVMGDQSMRHRYSPAVRRLADEHQVDLNQIRGTGHQGRITRKDVLEYIESGQPLQMGPNQGHQGQQERAQQTQRAQGAYDEDDHIPVRSSGMHLTEYPLNPKIEVEGQTFDNKGEYFIDVTPIRNTIASRMRQSVSEIPHAWTMIEVDLTNLVKLRNNVKDDFKRKEGVNLTYLSFLIKAVVNAIRDYPIMNSVWAVDKIIVKRDINISLAVGTEEAILTPVIHRADQKNIAGLAREIDDLAKRTRAGKLTPKDMTGGTFTINNTGSFGSILSYPIINYPQAVNLTFESIVKKPVVIDDMIAVRSMANLCLSLDHRILDGVICGRFLQRVKENLESYQPDMNVY